MRKNNKNIHTSPPRVAKAAQRVLVLGFPPILITLLRLYAEIRACAPLSDAKAAYYLGALEYPVAAVVLLFGGMLLAQYLAGRYEKND